MNICIITDGKKGHLNQAGGLAEAVLKRAQAIHPEGEHQIQTLSVEKLPRWKRFRYKGEPDTAPKIDLVICAGHGSHLASISLSRKHKCACMVCMRPSLPRCFFTLEFVPEHDLKPKDYKCKKIFATKGVLNRIKPQNPECKKRNILFLIGGESREYKWDSEQLLNQITHIARYSSSPIVLTTSRRTDPDFIAEVNQACPNIHVVPYEQTDDDWYQNNIDIAKEIWVTRDSVSMVYESITAGIPTGLLEMEPRTFIKGKVSRVTRGMEQLITDGQATSFTHWGQTHQLPAPTPLDEANRAADYIVEHFPHLFKGISSN
ncbi:MAG: ELM1/GtrOC1 family putative glycosyltransferase [Akkermansia sp.]